MYIYIYIERERERESGRQASRREASALGPGQVAGSRGGTGCGSARTPAAESDTLGMGVLSPGGSSRRQARISRWREKHM